MPFLRIIPSTPVLAYRITFLIVGLGLNKMGWSVARFFIPLDLQRCFDVHILKSYYLFLLIVIWISFMTLQVVITSINIDGNLLLIGSHQNDKVRSWISVMYLCSNSFYSLNVTCNYFREVCYTFPGSMNFWMHRFCHADLGILPSKLTRIHTDQLHLKTYPTAVSWIFSSIITFYILIISFHFLLKLRLAP